MFTAFLEKELRIDGSFSSVMKFQKLLNLITKDMSCTVYEDVIRDLIHNQYDLKNDLGIIMQSLQILLANSIIDLPFNYANSSKESILSGNHSEYRKVDIFFDNGIEDVASQVANDPELDTFEVHSDGVPVIPLDANIQETYADMMTEYHFLLEGYEMIDPEEGMTDDEYDKVVQEYAEQKFRDYRDEVLINQEFGFEKRSIFNEYVSGDFFAEFPDGRTAILEPNYQVDNYGNVRVKQIESLRVMDAGNHFQEFTTFMETIQEGYGYNKEKDGSVWKSLQPMTLNVPIDPIDYHSVIVGFKNMRNNGRMEYVRCSVPVLDAFNKPILESVAPETIKRMNRVSCTKGYAIQESDRIAKEEGEFFMEGIDFGNTGDMAPAK